MLTRPEEVDKSTNINRVECRGKKQKQYLSHSMRTNINRVECRVHYRRVSVSIGPGTNINRVECRDEHHIYILLWRQVTY